MYCGIDIGRENLAISFIIDQGDDEKRIVTYKGTTKCLYRYEVGQEPQEFKLVKSIDTYRDTCYLLSMIDELKYTKRTFIELQVSIHNNAILKMEGIIIGFLMGRFRQMEVITCASQRRTRTADKFIAEHGMLPIRLVASPPKTKINTMHMVAHLYREHYDFLVSFIDKDNQYNLGKMDDACDTILYAYMAMTG